MTHPAPGQGSPVDNPNYTDMEVPYEPQQGTGDAEKPQEQVDEEQAKALGLDEDDEPDEDEKPAKRRAGKHRKE